MASFDPTFPAYPIFALLSFFLVLTPLPWHLQAWNSGTCLFMIWTAVGCLNQFINSIVWHANAIDWAPVWCDISTRLTVGISVALPASSLCINRRLYKIATCQTTSQSYTLKRRAMMIDLSIGLGVPALQMILQFIVQGHRYDIWEDYGCYPTTVNTPPAYPLSFLWPNVISLISSVYCILTLKAFMVRRAQFNQFLTSNSSLSVNRYFRLMCLATAEILFTVPLSIYGLYHNITTIPFYPWISWSDIHFDWYSIGQYPAVLFRSNHVGVATLELTRWSLVLCAMVFFAFFGFADEAQRNYRRLYWAIAKRFGYIPPSDRKQPQLKAIALPIKKSFGRQSTSTLPVFVVHDKIESPPNYDSSLSPTSHCGDTDDTVTLYAESSNGITKEFDKFPSTPNSPRHSRDFDHFPSTPTSSRSSRFTI